MTTMPATALQRLLKYPHSAVFDKAPASELVLFMQDVARAARAIKTATGAKKINYGAYSDKLPHLHFHLVPKYEGGASWGSTFEMMPANKRLLDEAGYAAQIAAIKAAL